jgi:hypothetical protein
MAIEEQQIPHFAGSAETQQVETCSLDRDKKGEAKKQSKQNK